MAHILIVDDDRLVLSGLAAGLEMLGYTVAKASSGEEALAMLDSVKPDLIVMDACLPGISGIETTKQIQQRFGIPVIFLSAYDDPQTVRDAIALGGLSYLVKPITVKQLVPAIEKPRGLDLLGVVPLHQAAAGLGQRGQAASHQQVP